MPHPPTPDDDLWSSPAAVLSLGLLNVAVRIGVTAFVRASFRAHEAR